MHDNLIPPAKSGQIGIPPAPAVMRILSRFDRQKIDAFIEVAIELVDAGDGDPDLEANGDELDGTAAEDEHGELEHYSVGAGCPIADAAEEDDPSDTGNAEDEAITGELARYATGDTGPGCSLSDPGGCEHDGREQEFGV